MRPAPLLKSCGGCYETVEKEGSSAWSQDSAYQSWIDYARRDSAVNLLKAVDSPSDLFVGWTAVVDDWRWVFLGRSKRLYFGTRMFRFLRFRESEVHTEFLSEDGVKSYVLSPLRQSRSNLER